MAVWPYKTKQWQSIRAMRIANEPWCRYCLEIRKLTPTHAIDHIVPVKERPDLALDYDNTQGLCKHCHDSVKRREELAGTRIGCDEHGVPRGGWQA